MTLRNDRHLSMEGLKSRIGDGMIDTVVVAFTDMQGRLQGKRLHGRYFVEHVVGHGTEGCNYLLAVDVDMNTVDGYAISSWERGYGDMEFVLDDRTIRLLTHLPATAMIQCDLVWPDHSPVVQSPRSILQRQLDRCDERGWTALAGTELEFIAFDTTYEQAATDAYRDLTPANQYNVDYSILGTSRVEPLLRSIRNHMYDAGLDVEGAKGECNFGQHEIGFLYADALTTADNHAVYKTAAKEIAAQQGKSLTFMAKYNQREGSSCHIHLSLRGTDGSLVFWDEETGGRTPLYDHFVAGVLATVADFTLLYAPNINSYKRFADGSFAPDHHRLGHGQPHLRGPAGRSGRGRPDGEPGAGSRREPVPRARRDAGRRPARHRERAAARRTSSVGNAYASDNPRVPATMTNYTRVRACRIPRSGVPAPRRPAGIARPEYVDRPAPERFSGQEVKDAETIERMRVAGRLAARPARWSAATSRPGVTTDELDRIGHEFLLDHGAYPSTLGYRGFPKSLCTEVNEVICHGIPDSTVLADGDIVNIDITAYHRRRPRRHQRDLPRRRRRRGVPAAGGAHPARRSPRHQGGPPGRRVNVIGRVIESYARRFGYGVVRDFTGHGIGTAFHSGLVIPHYDDAAPRHGDRAPA